MGRNSSVLSEHSERGDYALGNGVDYTNYTNHCDSLTAWRIEKARGTVLEARKVYEQGLYAFCLNRSYYAVFYAMQAANSLYRYDSRKQSGVISYFRKTFLKTGILNIFPRSRRQRQGVFRLIVRRQ